MLSALKEQGFPGIWVISLLYFAPGGAVVMTPGFLWFAGYLGGLPGDCLIIVTFFKHSARNRVKCQLYRTHSGHGME